MCTRFCVFFPFLHLSLKQYLSSRNPSVPIYTSPPHPSHAQLTHGSTMVPTSDQGTTLSCGNLCFFGKAFFSKERFVYNLNIELFTGFPNDFFCRFSNFTLQYMPAIFRRKNKNFVPVKFSKRSKAKRDYFLLTL